MLETLHSAFSWVCGQSPDHTWLPGGLTLPCCQRCIGLYVGAGAAMLLHALLRPRSSAWFLELHGLFLLLMVPFGFHWLSQGELLRAWTGVLFGFGLVAFLSLTLPAQNVVAGSSTARTKTTGLYWSGLVLTLLAVPALAIWGGRGAAFVLSGLAALGAAALALVALVNCGLGLVLAARWLHGRVAHART